MPRGITRRAAARFLLAGPAVLAFPEVVPAVAPPRRTSSKLTFSPAERREIDKSIAQLRSTVAKVRKVGIPMGAEPAFVFRPLLPKR